MVIADQEATQGKAFNMALTKCSACTDKKQPITIASAFTAEKSIS